MQELKNDLQNEIKSHLKESITGNHIHNKAKDLNKIEVIYNYLIKRTILSYYQITASRKDLLTSIGKKSCKKP
jgi:hypothetical protein